MGKGNREQKRQTATMERETVAPGLDSQAVRRTEAEEARERDAAREREVRDRDLPLGGYGALAAAFNIGAAAIGAAAERMAAEKVPRKFKTVDLLVLGLATYRLSRLISKDLVTRPLRKPFTRLESYGDNPHEVEEKPHGTGMRRAIGDLLVCPMCVGTWVAAALVAGYTLLPRGTRALSRVFAADAMSEALNTAHAAIWEKLRS